MVFFTHTGDVVEFNALSSGNVDTRCAVVECVLEEHGQEDSKECRREVAAVLYAAAHRYGFGCSTVLADYAVQFLVDRCNHLEQSWGHFYVDL